MRVGLVIENFNLSMGGGERYAIEFVRQLINDGNEVHVFSTSFGNHFENVQAHKIPTIRMPKSLRVISFAMNSRKLVSQHDLDMIFGFGGTPYVDIYRPGGGTEREWFIQNMKSIDQDFCRVVNDKFRRIGLNQLVSFLIEAMIYRSEKLKLVIANSKMVKNAIMKHHGFPESRIKVVYNGVDLYKFDIKNRNIIGRDVRKKNGIGDNEITLLFMANNFRLKGLHCLIKSIAALRILVDLPFKVIIVGRGRINKYKKMAKDIGVTNEFIFLGQVEKPEQIFAAADIFVHPTFYDPCANVCLEALASGLPVITTAFNGVAELITDAVEGFVIKDPRLTEILAEKLAHFFPESIRKEAGRKARILAERYSWKRNYLEIIEAVGRIR